MIDRDGSPFSQQKRYGMLRTAIYVNPLVAALPGVMIFIVSIAFNLFSDGLRTAMEVKE